MRLFDEVRAAGYLGAGTQTAALAGDRRGRTATAQRLRRGAAMKSPAAGRRGRLRAMMADLRELLLLPSAVHACAREERGHR